MGIHVVITHMGSYSKDLLMLEPLFRAVHAHTLKSAQKTRKHNSQTFDYLRLEEERTVRKHPL